MPLRSAPIILAIVSLAVFAFAACQNPGPTVVAQPEPLPPLGVIVPITGEGGDAPAGDGSVPAAFITQCGICHTVAGTSAAAVIGPELTEIGVIAATRTSLDAEAYIRQSIEDPGAYLSPGYTNLMPAGLVDTLGGDYEAVVSYLLSLQGAPAEEAASTTDAASS